MSQVRIRHPAKRNAACEFHRDEVSEVRTEVRAFNRNWCLIMPLDQKAIIKQIDDILGKSDLGAGHLMMSDAISKALTLLFSAIHRLAPPSSVYVNNVKLYEAHQTQSIERALALDPVRGILQALRDDYESGYLQSVVELIHAEIFADFLEMTDYLLQQGYKDPAAVVIGSVLHT